MVYNILNTNETLFRVGALIIVTISADAKKTHAFFIGLTSFSPIDVRRPLFRYKIDNVTYKYEMIHK